MSTLLKGVVLTLGVALAPMAANISFGSNNTLENQLPQIAPATKTTEHTFNQQSTLIPVALKTHQDHLDSQKKALDESYKVLKTSLDRAYAPKSIDRSSKPDRKTSVTVSRLRQSPLSLQDLPQGRWEHLQGASRQSGKTLHGFDITFYNDTGITKYGAYTSKDLTIAVDPEVIPPGSIVEIHLPNGKKIYRQAQDTGKKVKKSVIDVYYPASDKELRKLGRLKDITVRIVGKATVPQHVIAKK